MKKIVFFTGAGISKESGIDTFRDIDGLWYGYDPNVVANVSTWKSKYKSKEEVKENRQTMLDFYNDRRRQLKDVKPNLAHTLIAELENNPNYEVHIITQNVDDLHERAGSTNVMHLHGELKKIRSTVDGSIIIEHEGDINVGDKCPKGSQLRPHIVWFGEHVPNIIPAIKLVDSADIIVAVGTSLQVEPAASIFTGCPWEMEKYYIDLNVDEEQIEIFNKVNNIITINDLASTGVRELIDVYLS